MKKLMMTVVGALALGAVAQDIPEPVAVPEPVPAPVATPAMLTAEVSVSIPAPAPVIVPALSIEEFEPGALCKLYSVTFKKNVVNTKPEALVEALQYETPVASEFDLSATFDGKSVARSANGCDYNMVSWEGVIVSPVSGKFVFAFSVDRGLSFVAEINGKQLQSYRNKPAAMVVDLHKGPNRFKLTRAYFRDTKMSIQYRPEGGVGSAILTPQELKHLAQEEEANWQFK